ncbi:hypothetical protein ABCR94_34115 [Streptomyces sp. 21So2-11]|uniref:hypothetical protein n=1 Tax=Streptomyces sp. 21So2-11 TaxID=3144408 RepID=UPI00321B4513
MLKTTGRALAGAALALLPMIGAAPVQAAENIRLPLTEAVDALAKATESRNGYARDAFKHWIDADKDQCSTRSEVLRSCC